MKRQTSKINMDYFNNITEPRVAYILGLLWADGHVADSKILENKRRSSCRTSIECKKIDVEDFENHFDFIGIWSKYIRQRAHNKTPNKTLSTGDKNFCNFLLENDFKLKSSVSPSKILEKIPNDLKKYFVLGWFDGDGCIYINKKNGNYQIAYTGTYSQDWSELENFMNNNGIPFGVKRAIVKSGNSYSQLRITRKSSIIKLKNLFYDTDHIGLSRKKEKIYSL